MTFVDKMSKFYLRKTRSPCCKKSH